MKLRILCYGKPSAIAMHPVGMRGKVRIKQNVWGNWNGYIGARKVWEIGASKFDAELWLEEQQAIQGQSLTPT